MQVIYMMPGSYGICHDHQCLSLSYSWCLRFAI